jgi:D-sedoheptulose 7-phosphate isomerase
MTVFDPQGFWVSEFSEHEALVAQTKNALKEPFFSLLSACKTAIEQGNKILFFGNGGSAADAQHLATELTVRYKTDRAPIAAIALTTDTSALTAIGNDFGFDYLFSRQIAALGRQGDVAIGITTSGNSQNVLKALEEARRLGITTVGLTGKTGGKMIAQNLCDISLCVPSTTTARIQEMHIMLGQMLCGALEISLGLLDTAEKKTA